MWVRAVPCCSAQLISVELTYSGPMSSLIAKGWPRHSAQVPDEMRRFVNWFNQTAPRGAAPLPALTRAALGHLWFESIHPFEDGNGRLGRALAEKSLAQNIGQPSLIALAYAIERDRRSYYDQLEIHQKSLDVTDWLIWFGKKVL